jgi:hypothetical protein
MVPFADLVSARFAFLVTDFGFTRGTSADAGVEKYTRFPLEVTLIWGQGEIDVILSVAYSYSLSHAIFSPYISRSFYLPELALRKNPHAFSIQHGWEVIPGPITSPERVDLELTRRAALLRKYCTPLLGGDLTLLEEITRERRATAPNPRLERP